MEENRTEDKFDHLRRPKLAYRIEACEHRLPADAVVRIAVDVRELRERIDGEVARRHR